MATQQSFEDKLKAYLAPILVTIFGGFFMSNILEMKADLKLLLSHDNAQIIQIETINGTINELKQRIYKLEDEIRELNKSRKLTSYVADKTKLLVLTKTGYRYESV